VGVNKSKIDAFSRGNINEVFRGNKKWGLTLKTGPEVMGGRVEGDMGPSEGKNLGREE